MFSNEYHKILLDNIDSLSSEEDIYNFVKAFRNLLRLYNILSGFSEFKWCDLSITEQQFEDCKSKYLDIKERIDIRGNSGEKVSILDNLDFALELIHKDKINVTYILRLLSKYLEAGTVEEKVREKENINNILNSNPQLRSKKELIEQFIDTTLEGINADDIDEEYDKFVEVEKEKALDKLVETEKLKRQELTNVIDTYLYDGRKPLNDDIAKTLEVKPKLLERKKVIPRVLDKITSFVEKFYDR